MSTCSRFRRSAIPVSLTLSLVLLSYPEPRPAFAGPGVFAGPSFTDIGAGLPGADAPSSSWGDFDEDGDLDLLLTGRALQSGPVFARIYRNDAGAFIDIGAGLPGVQTGDGAWGDYDRDGDLDIALTGWVDASTRLTEVFRNDDGAFVDINAGLIPVMNSTVDWGDYDNDGDLDVLLTGREGTNYYTRIYRNDGEVFADIGAGITGVAFGSALWGDYDTDGDLDFVLAGSTGAARISRIYRNDEGVFVGRNVHPAFPGIANTAAAWGDYDADGDLDLFLAGLWSDRSSVIFTNDSGFFTWTQNVTGVNDGAAAWGDCDNDGDLDLLLTGETASSSRMTSIYRNDAGWFADMGAGLPGTQSSAVAWGDYDNDRDLDFLLMGYTGEGPNLSFCRIYRNGSAVADTPPGVPVNLSVLVVGAVATFSWDASTDGETPAPGLTYNLRVGTTPGGPEIVSAMADLATGYRRVARFGNAYHRTSRVIHLPAVPTNLYWSVQAVDACFLGSAFAMEQHVSTGLEPGPVPARFALHPCTPNPFNPATTIRFALPRAERAVLVVYDVSGRRVATIADGVFGPGEFDAAWDGTDDTGRDVASGVYFARLVAGDLAAVRKMALLR